MVKKKYSKAGKFWGTVLMVYLCCIGLTFFVELLQNALPDLNPIHIFFRDFDFSDAYYKIREDTTRINEIVVVDIKCGGRQKIANLIQVISQAGADVIGVDINFDESNLHKVGTESLDSVLKSCPNVVLGYDYLKQNSGNMGKGGLHATKEHWGFTNFSDSSSTIRTAPLTLMRNKDQIKSFALSVASFGQPVDVDSTLRIRYLPVTAFHTYDGDSVVTDTSKYNKFLKGKTVLLGETKRFGTLCGNNDLHFTPENPKMAGRSFPDMEGVYIQANVIRNIAQGRIARLSEISSSTIWLLLMIIFLPTLALMIHIYCRPSHFSHIVMTLVYEPLVYVCYIALCYALFRHGVYMSFIFPYLVFSLSPLAIYLIDQLDIHLVKWFSIKPLTCFFVLKNPKSR